MSAIWYIIGGAAACVIVGVIISFFFAKDGKKKKSSPKKDEDEKKVEQKKASPASTPFPTVGCSVLSLIALLGVFQMRGCVQDLHEHPYIPEWKKIENRLTSELPEHYPTAAQELFVIAPGGLSPRIMGPARIKYADPEPTRDTYLYIRHPYEEPLFTTLSSTWGSICAYEKYTWVVIENKSNMPITISVVKGE